MDLMPHRIGGIALAGVLALVCSASTFAQTPNVHAFADRYGLAKPPRRDAGGDAAALLQFQSARRLHDRAARSDRYGASVLAMRDLLRERAEAARPRIGPA